MNKKGKPARKCHGCILNMGERCAIYEEPHDKWHNSKCTSYNDQELYHKYLEDMEGAKKHKTEEHHQGMKGKR
jgi:hypothetical protein